jgi:ubiquinone/menaquinone biosynthesis C-methylase UbiE
MFPLPDELAEILRRVGFSRVDYRRFTNGIAVGHLAVK